MLFFFSFQLSLLWIWYQTHLTLTLASLEGGVLSTVKLLCVGVKEKWSIIFLILKKKKHCLSVSDEITHSGNTVQMNLLETAVSQKKNIHQVVVISFFLIMIVLLGIWWDSITLQQDWDVFVCSVRKCKTDVSQNFWCTYERNYVSKENPLWWNEGSQIASICHCYKVTLAVYTWVPRDRLVTGHVNLWMISTEKKK